MCDLELARLWPKVGPVRGSQKPTLRESTVGIHMAHIGATSPGLGEGPMLPAWKQERETCAEAIKVLSASP